MADESGLIYFVHLGLIFTLMRYPMPTEAELFRFKQGLEEVHTKEDFRLNMCWLDEYDEIVCKEKITPSTLVQTAQTKDMLFWLFSYREGAFNKDLLLYFMEKHVSPSPMSKFYADYFGFRRNR